MTEYLQWHKLIPIDRHADFLSGERKYCKAEEDAFHADPVVKQAWRPNDVNLVVSESNLEELRAALLDKREEYLLNYLENELD